MTEDQEAAIERACARLAIAFTNHVDNRRPDEAAAVFARDGEFERRGETLAGRDVIRDTLKARPATMLTRHMCANLAIDVIDENNARGVVSFTVYMHQFAEGEAGGVAPLRDPEAIGEYHDVYVRTDEGWRIKRRNTTVAFRRQPKKSA